MRPLPAGLSSRLGYNIALWLGVILHLSLDMRLTSAGAILRNVPRIP